MDFLNRICLIFGLLKRQFIIAVWSASDILQFDLASCKNDLFWRSHLRFDATPILNNTILDCPDFTTVTMMLVTDVGDEICWWQY